MAGRMTGRRHLRVSRSLMILFIRKRPLLAMRPAGSGGEGQRLACSVEVKVLRGRIVYRGGGDEGGGRSGEGAQAGTTAEMG